MADQSSFLVPILREMTFGIDAWKKPAKVVSTGNISLVGLQTVDGVALVAGDEVLCVGQSSAAQNGVWVAASGAWARRSDATNSERLFEGVRVPVTRGTTGAGSVYRLATTGKINVGTTAQTWELDSQGASGDVDPTPGTLALRGEDGEVRAAWVEAGSGTKPTSGDIRGPEDFQIVARVPNGGGEDSRVLGLDGTSLNIGDSNTSARIRTADVIELASGPSETVFGRLVPSYPSAVGDIGILADGRLCVALNAIGLRPLATLAETRDRHEYPKLTADANAADPMTEAAMSGPVQADMSVEAIGFVPSASLTVNDTNRATLTISYRRAALGEVVSLATIVTRTTGLNASGHFVAFQPVPFDSLAFLVPSGAVLTCSITKTGSGIVVPAGVFYAVLRPYAATV